VTDRNCDRLDGPAGDPPADDAAVLWLQSAAEQVRVERGEAPEPAPGEQTTVTITGIRLRS
jgi:hypothetical protein